MLRVGSNRTRRFRSSLNSPPPPKPCLYVLIAHTCRCATKKNRPNMNVHNPSNTSSSPSRIVVPWRRFSSGLWRVPKGDIAAAYCADTFPKIKVFTHEGRLFTNCGCHYVKFFEVEADCYPLVPADEYHGLNSVPYSYEGREARFRGQVFRLGAKVLFVASTPTLAEWRHLLRVLYADGGYFATGCTYAEFLANHFDPHSEIGRAARFQELAECGAKPRPRTQVEMCLLLAHDTAGINQLQQLDFAL